MVSNLYISDNLNFDIISSSSASSSILAVAIVVVGVVVNWKNQKYHLLKHLLMKLLFQFIF